MVNESLNEWYYNDHDRLLTELNIAKSNLKNYFIFGFEQRENIVIFGLFDVDGISENISIEFPVFYPFNPPRVRIWENLAFNQFKKLLDSRHQNWDDSLCLFTQDWGDNSWHFQMNLLNVFQRMTDSIRKARAKTHNDQHTSINNVIPGKLIPNSDDFLPVSEMNSILTSSEQNGTFFLFKLSKNSSSYIYFVGDLDESKQKSKKYARKFNMEISDSPLKGYFIKFPFKIEEFRDKFTTLEEIFSSIKKECNEELNTIEYLLLIFSDTKIPDVQERDPNQYHNHQTFTYILKNQEFSNLNKFPLRNVYTLNLPNDIFQRTRGVYGDSVEDLKQFEVLLLGLGTIGSGIALELVKNGITKFHLYDFDILHPVNICRHLGNINEIGVNKPDIVENRLKLKNPLVKINKITHNPFENKNYLEEFFNIIESVDLIVETTGVYQVNNVLNKIAWDHGKPVIYAWCGPNAELGRIFRVIPNETACFNCIDLQLRKEPKKYPSVKTTQNGFESPQIVGYRQPGIPGISIDINLISLFVTKFCIATLLPKNQSIKLESHHYIWQNKRNRNFDPSSDIALIPQMFKKIDRCPICKQIKRKNNPQKRKEIEKILERSKKNLKHWVKSK